MDEYTKLLQRLLADYGYTVIFFAMLLENTLLLGLIVPGILVLLITGYAAGSGNISLEFGWLAGVFGTLIGDNISYLLGRHCTQKIGVIKSFVEKNQALSQKINSERWYILIFFPFPPYLRVALPAILGFTGYPVKRWIALDLVGAMLFNTAFILTGYFVAKTTGLFTKATNISNYVQYIFMGLLAIYLIKLLISRLRQRRLGKAE